MNINDILEVAGGVLLAFYTLRLVDYIKAAPERARQKRKAEEFGEFMHQMAHDLAQKLEADQAKKPRRKPATKKPVAKGPLAKKGASNANAKATAKR